MPRIVYEPWKPGSDALVDVRRAAAICEDYAEQGYDLTLRQLYYQFVSRGFIPNNVRSYKRLGDIVNRARLAGLLDWDYITDRTRNLESVQHFDSPAEILDVAARSFRLDKWASSPVRVEVWVEKEALAGVVERVARRLDVAYFSCRGYVSQSELWTAGQRIGGYLEAGQRVVVLHLGDHDPSGIDMTRDITDRLERFTDRDWYNNRRGDFGSTTTVGAIRESMAEHVDGTPLEVRRIALNMDQVEEYAPPPNPAKLTDSRSDSYVAAYGTESWELDALDPSVLDALIERHVLDERDDDTWDEAYAEEETHRAQLGQVSDQWEDIAARLDEGE